MYQRLVQTFPAYDKLDGVYYLIGYCHAETGRWDIARTGVAQPRVRESLHVHRRGAAEGERPRRRRRGSRQGASCARARAEDAAAAAPSAALEDPYAECQPAVKDSKFWAETWLRIGEYHFDFDVTPSGLSHAISAYNKVLEKPDDRNYNLALYKLAWTYYRASRYPEAMENFWKLVAVVGRRAQAHR